MSYTQSLCLLSCVSDWQSTWIIDIGASDHMCHNKDLFDSFVALAKPNSVTLANGKCVLVTHAGTVTFKNHLTLHGVLYIPSFRYNLLSVSKLASQQNCYIIFTPQYCLMQAPSLRRLQVLGEIYAGLYLFKPRVGISSEASTSSL